MIRIAPTFVLTFLVILSACQTEQAPSSDAQAQALLSQMTLDQKIGQMTQIDQKFLDSIQDISALHIGSLLSGGGSHPDSNEVNAWVDMIQGYQREALASDAGIPLIYGIDAVHGHSNVLNATIFPHNIGLGATRDADLLQRIGYATAEEVAATGIDWTFAPCLATPQDYRWGRTYEGYSDDPQWVADMGMAYFQGFLQYNDAHERNMVTCAKHFIGDGNTTFGTGINNLVDRGNTEMSEEELWHTLIPVYQEVIDAGVPTIMASYNLWNGTKCHGSHRLLTEILKDSLGFDGFIVSDWAGINEIPGDYPSDVITGVNAGIDLFMVPGDTEHYRRFIELVKAGVESGDIAMSRIDDAVTRILKVKIEAGLMDLPVAEPTEAERSDLGAEHNRQLAREAVRKSIVMLKNNGVLPLKEEVMVTGPGANNVGMQCGGWTIEWQGGMGDITEGTSILEAFESTVGATEFEHQDDLIQRGYKKPVVLVIGETPYTEFIGDRVSLDLDSVDVQWVVDLKQMGYPVVTVLLSGRPMNISEVLELSDAFVCAWLPGSEGAGVVDVLTGDYNPTGVLPMPWPSRAEEGAAAEELLFVRGFGLRYEE